MSPKKQSSSPSKNLARSVTNLSLNESPRSLLRMSPSLLKKIAATPLHLYPTPAAYAALEGVAGRTLYQIAPRYVLCCNGSDDGIFLLMQTFGLKQRTRPVLLLAPTFSMYHHYAKVLALPVESLPLDEDFYPQMDALVAKIQRLQPSLIFIPNPLAPTGRAIDTKDILRILDVAQQSIVVVDEAYAEFSSQRSFVKEVKTYKNLVVLRTLSKFYGLAGLRAGFVISSFRDELRSVQAPFSMSSLSVMLAQHAIEQLDQPAKKMSLHREVHTQRKALIETLRNARFIRTVSDSDANFVFATTHSTAQLEAFEAFLLEGGFLIKNFHSHYPNSMRIGIPSAQKIKSFLALIRQFDKRSGWIL